jgi:hypothetical protein
MTATDQSGNDTKTDASGNDTTKTDASGNDTTSSSSFNKDNYLDKNTLMLTASFLAIFYNLCILGYILRWIGSESSFNQGRNC